MSPANVAMLAAAGLGLALLGEHQINGDDSLVSKTIDTLTDRGEKYRPFITAAEREYGLPEGLLYRLLYKESRYREDIITGATRSPVGALGIAQFMPATAAELGVNPLDPYASIDAAARYLARLKASLGDWASAVAAYNWGIGNVKRKGMAAAPAETRDYVAFIIIDGGYANA